MSKRVTNEMLFRELGEISIEIAHLKNDVADLKVKQQAEIEALRNRIMGLEKHKSYVNGIAAAVSTATAIIVSFIVKNFS